MGFWHSGEHRYRLYTDQERKEYGEKKREERRKAWHAKFISKWSLLSERGWSKEAVAEFLGPFFDTDSPTLAFYRYRVERAEKSKRFKAFMEKRKTEDTEWKTALSRADLKKRSPLWTEGAIKRFLINPLIKGRFTRYLAADVLQAEQSEAFKEWATKRR